MEEIYKEHIIHPGARRVPHSTTEWRPTVQISWREGSSELMKILHLKRSFAAQTTAEQQALLFAKKWIDDGKPIIEP
jgi:hypothetical protein